MAEEIMENNEVKAENVSEKIPEKKIDVSNIKKNPWMIAAIVLGIIVVILLIWIFAFRGSATGNVTGNVVSIGDAGQNVIKFASSQGLDATIVNSSDEGAFYKIYLLMNGQNFPVYVTKDGENMATSLIPLTAVIDNGGNGGSSDGGETPQDVPKTDKPKVEAFIFSYCPYGLQFEKALLPVYDLLKNKADINIVAIGAMHGEYEKIESLRQISIEKLYNRDKLFAYLKEFDTNTDIGACRGDEACLNKYLPAIYSKLGIDKAKVETYMKSNAEEVYNEQGARANELGISGSPTFVINGVQVQVSRTPDSIKQVVCNAFNTAPSECSKNLSTSSASPGFGASSSGSASSASSAGGCAAA